MKNTQKGFSIALVVIVIFIVLAGIAYLSSKNATPSQNPPQTAPTSTAQTAAPAKQTTATVEQTGVKQAVQTQPLTKNERIIQDMQSLRTIAQAVKNNTGTSALFCNNGLVNTALYSGLPALIADIVATQGVSNQANAGLTCLSSKTVYAFQISFTVKTAVPGYASYCVDSAGNAGYDTKYLLNSAAISCQAVQ